MATWFAQNSSVNIDSVNQWNSAADGSGSWLTWASLGASDILVCNAKTSIAINVDFTCATLHNGTTYGGTTGGGFTVSTARTITASLVAGTATLLTPSSSGYTLAIVGNLTGGTNSSGVAYTQGVSITCNITGNVTGAAGHAVNYSVGTINITGDVTGGSSNQQAGVRQSSSILTVNGNVTGGSSGGVGVYSTGSNTTTVNGNISGAAGGITNYALYSQGSNPVTVNSGNIINQVASVACAGRLKWNPGATNYVEIATTASTQKYYYLRNATGAGMRGGFNG